MIEIAEALLAHIRSKQFLVCAAAAPDASGQTTLADITAALQIRSAECLRLATYLQEKGLVEPTPDARSVRLTVKGQRLVRRMTRPGSETEAGGEPLLEPPPPAA